MRNPVRAWILRGYHRLKPWLEALEAQTAAEPAPAVPPGVFLQPAFLNRLVEEVERAQHGHRELGLAVFHLPWTAAALRQRRAVEEALRDCLHRGEIPGQLAEDVLAVVLPHASPETPRAVARIARLLSPVAKGPVPAGLACYPEDGQHAADLLRRATDRCTAACPPVEATWEAGLGEPELAQR